ncbi:MAG: DUF6390 family protein [Candidatus Daviesbacteria bacterium]|nr:DUF6390 family protein [Candidatus Daviesbacteria bacterium]
MKERVDIEAIQLASRFAYGCQSVRLHEDKKLMSKMEVCIREGEASDLEKKFKTIPDLNVYTKTLSQITGLPQFSYPVMEAYWFGNDLLKQVQLKHYDLLLENYAQQETKSAIIELLKIKRPKFFATHHVFSILHTDIELNDIGNLQNLQIARDCTVRWGEVLEVENGRAKVTVVSLGENLGKLGLSQKEITLEVNPVFTPDLETGNTVAIHLLRAVKILSREEKENLSFWTNKILGSID